MFGGEDSFPRQVAQMKLHELIKVHDWSAVAATGIFVRDYEEHPDVLKLYWHVYNNLQHMYPSATTTIITIRQAVDDETGQVLAQCDVSGIKPNEETGDPELWSLSTTDWEEWLGMDVQDDTGRGLSGPELICHCLYEMTFHGWFPGDSGAFGDNLERIAARATRPNKKRYDAFISHASEDKSIVRQIVYYLERERYKIWFDELDLTIGDSLRQEIDRGLRIANYGIIVLSKAFFRKQWTQYELDGLVARQMEGQKVILPVWHEIDKRDVLEYSPSLADKVAIKTDQHPKTIAYRLIEAIRRK